MTNRVYAPGCLLLVLLLAGGGVRAQATTEPEPWILGVFPFVSPVVLFQRFSGLREHLKTALAHPVLLETARDFTVFVQRTDAGRYDILVTAPHFALRAALSGRYLLCARVATPLYGVFVVRQDSPLRRLEDLARRIVATPPESALITAVGQHHLEEVVGLTGEDHPRYLALPSHNAAFLAVLGDEADAAVLSVNVYAQAQRSGHVLREIGRTAEVPSTAVLVARRLGESMCREIVAALTEAPKGRRRSLGFPAYRAARLEEYLPLRPYLRLVPVEAP